MGVRAYVCACVRGCVAMRNESNSLVRLVFAIAVDVTIAIDVDVVIFP